MIQNNTPALGGRIENIKAGLANLAGISEHFGALKKRTKALEKGVVGQKESLEQLKTHTNNVDERIKVLEDGRDRLIKDHMSVNKTVNTLVIVQAKVEGLQAQTTDAIASIVKLDQSVTEHSAKLLELDGWANDDNVAIEEL